METSNSLLGRTDVRHRNEKNRKCREKDGEEGVLD